MGLSPWIESKSASSTREIKAFSEEQCQKKKKKIVSCLCFLRKQPWDAIGQHYKYKKEEKNTGRNSSAITIKVSHRRLASSSVHLQRGTPPASSRKDENTNKKFQRCGLHHVLQITKGV